MAYIEEVTYWNPAPVCKWKCDHAREKDVRGIILIDEYQRRYTDIKTAAKS